MAANDFRELSAEELTGRIQEMRQGLFNLRVRNTTKELENTSTIRQERRQLARALTVLNEKLREQGK